MPIFECKRCNELSHSLSAEGPAACPRCGMAAYRVLGEDAGRRRELGPCDHAALVYDDPALVAVFCARYLTEGIDRGDRVVAVAPDDLRALVQPLLAADVNVLIEWHATDAVYGEFDADRVAAGYDALLAAEPRTVRILAVTNSEIAVGVEPAEAERYERLAHELVARHAATVVCLYDTRGLAEEYLGAATRRHALTVVEGEVRRNEAFEYTPA